MPRIEIQPFEAAREALERMSKPGLLVTVGTVGNPITIGWASIGYQWTKPVFSVLVRPSRYSYGLLEENGDFTVNVPAAGDKALAKAAAWCGSHSGRDGDKYGPAGITKAPGIKTGIPYVAECPVHFECRTVHVNNVDAEALAPELRSMAYPDGDVHRIWHGEILGAWREA